MWEVFIVIAVFAMFLGPIMMLRPSVKDSKLAKLRQEAVERGLKLKSFSLFNKPVVIYRYPWPERLDITLWCLAKGELDHEIHFLGQWQWLQEPAPKCCWSDIKELVPNLSDEIVGVGANSEGVGFYWNERTSALLPELIDTLKKFSAKLYSSYLAEQKQ